MENTEQYSEIKAEGTRREWLLRCNDEEGEVAVCSIGVHSGEIELWGTDDAEAFRLESWQIAPFREALDEAITVADADLTRKRRSAEAKAAAQTIS